MTENDREKRLYYLRKYNRYYKTQIDILTDQSISLERQMNELKEENERLKKQLLTNMNDSKKPSSQTVLLELMYIRKMIEQLCATHNLPLHNDDFEQDQRRDDFIGAIHRQTKDITYANELRKEFVITMNEKTNDNRFNDEQDSSGTKGYAEQSHAQGNLLQDERQTNDTNEEMKGENETNHKRTESLAQVQKQDDTNEPTLARQVKQYGQREETSPEKEILEHGDKHSLPPAERSNTITFRDLQQATDIYAKPTTQMNQSKSTGNKQPQFDTPRTHVEQEEYFLPKLSKNHKKPEIVKKSIPERVTQPTESNQDTEDLSEESPTANIDRAKEMTEQRAEESIDTNKTNNELETHIANTSEVSSQSASTEDDDHTEASFVHLPDDSLRLDEDTDVRSPQIREEIPLEEMDEKDSDQRTEQAKKTDEKNIDHTNQSTFIKTLWNKIKGT